VDTTTQFISIILILAALVALVLATQFQRRRAFALRPIAAFEALPGAVGAAIEANRPLHLSLGSAGLGGERTLLALAGAELLYQVARRGAIGAASPLFTVSDPTAIPLGHDTLRRAYQSRGLLERYQPGAVHWYPAGPRSLAFAAALTAVMGDDHVGTNLLAGSFGPELALIGEAAHRRDQAIIAVSDQPEGQAVAYAFSDYPLIGEELFAGGAYLGTDAAHTGALVAQDVLRWLVIAALIVTAVAAAAGGG
jgi:hypothetical protein